MLPNWKERIIDILINQFYQIFPSVIVIAVFFILNINFGSNFIIIFTILYVLIYIFITNNKEKHANSDYKKGEIIFYYDEKIDIILNAVITFIVTVSILMFWYLKYISLHIKLIDNFIIFVYILSLFVMTIRGVGEIYKLNKKFKYYLDKYKRKIKD